VKPNARDGTTSNPSQKGQRMRSKSGNAKEFLLYCLFALFAAYVGWALNKPVMYAIGLAPASMAVLSLIRMVVRALEKSALDGK
jgi:hypothetical protein